MSIHGLLWKGSVSDTRLLLKSRGELLFKEKTFVQPAEIDRDKREREIKRERGCEEHTLRKSGIMSFKMPGPNFKVNTA